MPFETGGQRGFNRGAPHGAFMLSQTDWKHLQADEIYSNHEFVRGRPETKTEQVADKAWA